VREGARGVAVASEDRGAVTVFVPVHHLDPGRP
jgi:hypothetical protein